MFILQIYLAICNTQFTSSSMSEQSGFSLTLVTGIKVFSRIFKVNDDIFQAFILSNSPVKKSGPFKKLWKGHIQFFKSWLHIKFQGLFKDFIQFWLNSRTFKALKMNQFFFKDFQGFSRMTWEPWSMARWLKCFKWRY